MTPEEKLCSRSWRLVHSAGLLWSILSLGLLTGVGFLIRGVKAKNNLWIALGVGFLVVGVTLFATAGVNSGTKEAPVQTTAGDIWGWVWLTTFIGGMVTAVLTNKKWLMWKAHSNETKWYAQAGASHPAVNPSPTSGYIPDVTTGASDPVAAPHVVTFETPGETSSLNINAASAPMLVSALGIDNASAERIIAARRPLGSFTSFEQLIARAQVAPHLLIPHRARIAFGPPSEVSSQPGPAITDYKPSRKLFD